LLLFTQGVPIVDKFMLHPGASFWHQADTDGAVMAEITQKALAEGMGMNPRHLTAIKSSELRNRYFNELGATKLACLWVLEHCKKVQ